MKLPKGLDRMFFGGRSCRENPFEFYIRRDIVNGWNITYNLRIGRFLFWFYSDLAYACILGIDDIHEEYHDLYVDL